MKESLGFIRLMMVIGSLSPFFLLSAIKGSDIIDDLTLIGICSLLIIIPNSLLYLRITSARKANDIRTFTVKKLSDNREHLLVYLFAVLVPLYQASLDTWRDIGLIIVVLGFVVFLFMHLNLHYMNFVFALKGYKIYTLETEEAPWRIALLSTKDSIEIDTKQHLLRLSNTVYIEK
ncbi:hypothetical protein NI392_16085 [Vibrio alginolyticus]|uniref:hypothetical protein n=1 Tax=Vibrio harveyi group TaxID=717610 RepID=UPI002659FB34|nr:MULTISPECIES: hypothetical protein [Vibrio harveyi group]EGQ9180260.1 hypothetical protein [Vibrio alginolyticus]MCR9846731.1 hypothetical protein [Vibrio antiquarius]MCR9912318.1 hypothetical protein [Vibrio antiquarius]WMN46758.1 hypothetical protein NI392_16085 [Vibrio alginolyticus]